ncbi:hypothetical protein BH11ACT5_BH11ACT5_15520 [soil metagenome]
MTRASVIVVAAASLALLAGCAPAPELPAPITQAEATERMAEQNQGWWDSMFPDEPMPVIEPVEYLDINDPGTISNDCMRDADIDGLVFGADASWSIVDGDAGTMEEVSRTQFICAQKYPYDLSDPAAMGMLSDAELAYIWDYNQSRLVPCLQLLGYTVINRTGDYQAQSYWSPYFEMAPMPRSNEEWARIDLRCPPSPVGPLVRPTGG